MKKLFLILSAVGITLSAAADEGMWLLPYIKKMNIKQMRAKGCRLSADDIYSADKSSLKDAIVVFGGGCTGEIVSPDGLLFTNHHCGYSSIQQLSSVDHDYLADGFWAENREGELPAPGLKVRFVRHIIDVTPDVIGNIPSIAGEDEYMTIAEQNIAALTKELEAQYPGMEIIVPSFFGNNQFFAFVYEVYTDVRLVGTPPSSIGKFGGDTDNWMWPRHTGDFSIFRVYAGKDNRPAAYSKDNVPYKAERWLDISLKGYDEGDFAMIMGFPGSTQRYMTSYEIDDMLEVSNPQRIYIRGERQKILRSFMDKDQAIRIQYAAKYAQSSNYWKNSIGMSRGIEKLDVRSKKLAQEGGLLGLGCRQHPARGAFHGGSAHDRALYRSDTRPVGQNAVCKRGHVRRHRAHTRRSHGTGARRRGVYRETPRGIVQLLQGLQRRGGPRRSQTHAAHIPRERIGAAVGIRRCDRRPLRRRLGRIRRLSLRQLEVHFVRGLLRRYRKQGGYIGRPGRRARRLGRRGIYTALYAQLAPLRKIYDEDTAAT